MRRAVLLAASALAACSARDPAQLVVVVSSSLGVPAEMDGIQLVVRDAAGEIGERRSIGLARASDLPASFGVVPRGGDVTRPVDLEVIATLGGARLFSTRVRTGFVAGRRLRLDVRLDRRCVGLGCGESQSCDDGACGAPAQVDPSTLAPYEGLPDAGPPPDVGPTDTGPTPRDASGDAGADVPGPDATPIDTGPDAGPRDALPACTYGDDYIAARDPADGDFGDFTLARGTNEYGLVWSRFDYRTSRGELRFIRIAADGASRADDGVRVIPTTFSGTTARAIKPSMLFTGTDYALAWEDTRQTPAPEISDIRFARISAGTREPIRTTPVRATSVLEMRPVLLADGGEFLVAYLYDYSQGRLVRTSSSGVPLGGDTDLENAGYLDMAAAMGRRELAYVASRYVENQNSDLYFHRVDPAGPTVITLSPPPLTRTDLGSIEQRLVSEAGGYGLVWLEETAGGTYDIWFMRLDLDGRVRLAPTLIAPNLVIYERPALAWTAQHGFLLGWKTGDLIWHLVRVSPEGVVTALPAHATRATAAPGLAAAPGGFAVAWGKDEDVHFTFVRCP